MCNICQFCFYLMTFWLFFSEKEKNLTAACRITYANQTLSEEANTKENTPASFTYPLIARTSETSNSAFVIEVKVCENGTPFSACNCRWLYEKVLVCRSQKFNSTCKADNSEMHFSLLIKRTYSDVMWELLRQNYTPLLLKHSKLQVTYPAMITGLHVNGEKVNGTHLVEESQEVFFSCFFRNGNPPVTIRMADDNGHTLSSTRNREGPLTLSRDIRCQSVWPNIRCEAPGSELNESVTILVKCLPQFYQRSSQIFALTNVLAKGLTLRIKSYTSNIRKCLMSINLPLPTFKELKCELSGSIPEFNLTVRFDGESWTGEGIWTLHLVTELGFSNITLGFVNTTQFYGQESEISNDKNGRRTGELTF